MKRTMLKSKIHSATLTGAQLEYEGSIAVDREILEAANILPGEQVHVLNLNNGSRIVTYAIEAPSGSGEMALNGPAARTGLVGDRVIVLAYCEMADADARSFKPKVAWVDAENRLTKVEEAVPQAH